MDELPRSLRNILFKYHSLIDTPSFPRSHRHSLRQCTVCSLHTSYFICNTSYESEPSPSLSLLFVHTCGWDTRARSLVKNIIPFVMKEPNELLRVTEQEHFEKRKRKGWPKHKKGLSEQMHMVHVHSLSKQRMPPLSPLSPPPNI